MSHCMTLRINSKRIMTALVSGLALATVAGCATLIPRNLPKTIAEEGESSYSYIPLDPLPVLLKRDSTCKTYKGILDSLPDEAVRIAVGTYDASGSLSYGPGKIGLENHSYQVVLDYIDVDEATLTVEVTRETMADKTPVSVFDTTVSPSKTTYKVTQGSALVHSYAPYAQYAPPAASNPPKDNWPGSGPGAPQTSAETVSMPVYIGVGLRLTATVRVLKGNANLSSLGSLAAGAEAGTLNGSLVVQTLGINGKSVSTTLPLPSELNQTTIQNAILALGSIKAILYDENNVQVTPRVVGIYNPVGGGQQYINGVISALAVSPAKWEQPCAIVAAETAAPTATR